jgi:tetratricopeptide (TPR) repeat protein
MIAISLRSIKIRIISSLLLVLGFGTLGWFVVREAAGESMAVFLQRQRDLSPEAKVESADAALRFSSRNPSIHWLRGGAYFAAADADADDGLLRVALDELRMAAQMRSQDYRIWLSLGRVLERTGSIAEARAAFESALRLAPNHFEPRWFLGNHLLRAGDRDASFAQMRTALASRPSALPLIFDYAWSAFGGDGKAIAAALDPSPELKTRIVCLLISRGKVDDGLALWREIKSPGVDDIQKTVESLIAAGRYTAAYDIWRSADLPSRPAPDADSLIANGDFEGSFPLNSTVPFFSWQIAPSTIMRAYLELKDPYRGKHSLRFSFSMEGNRPITLASQTVPVESSKKYCLSFYVKTDGLESLSTPYVEIFDPADPQRAHVETRHFPTRSNKWAKYDIAIGTTAATEALTVRLQRQPCSLPPCPIEGRIWFDNFRLNECSEAKKTEAQIQAAMDTEEIEEIIEN